ncbi:DUF2142 domain-containing protein [Frigoribacterium sp. CFBP 8766]|uniref:DUF2142 domain-containing protein n=1 Tax=Frigoribacterium sp. CFBP 8766 TaxID=2775273 RepID=UPI00177DF77E|nr:DUF2142 domain-containing protein [Frigoribacterium sp. CFBP 8766]
MHAPAEPRRPGRRARTRTDAEVLGRVGRAGPVALFVVAFLVFFGTAALWALSTPIGASPDEPSHIIKAASTVRGQLIGAPGARPQDKIVQVPETVAGSANTICMSHASEVTADCLLPFGSDTKLVAATTTAGLYNPVYYVLVGWPSLLELGKGQMFLMRLASAAACAFFLAAAVTALARLPRPVLPVLAVFAVSTPMTYFLMGSVNPNALEIATTASFASSLLVVTSTAPGRRASWWLAASLAASGGLLVHTRGLSPLWLGVAVLVVAIGVGVPRFVSRVVRPPVLLSVLVVTASTVPAVLWTLRSGSLDAVGVYGGAGTTPADGFVHVLETTTDYSAQAIGNFGWLDTPAPGYVVFLYSVLLGLVVAAALFLRDSVRRRVAVGTAALAVLVLPAAVQASSVAESGYIWQGRYTMPAVVVLVVVAAWAVGDALPVRRRAEDVRRFATCVLVVTGVAQLACLLTSLRRYSAGLSAPWPRVFSEPAWHPPLLGTVGWAVLLLACVAVATVAARWLVLAAGADSPRGDGSVSDTTDADGPSRSKSRSTVTVAEAPVPAGAAAASGPVAADRP